MWKVILYIIAFIFVLNTISFATIINIPVDYPTIQQGIDSSVDGDTVLVQPGTYVENINFNGYNIVLGSLFLITQDTSYIEQTVIDGDSLGRVVIFENYEDSTAQLYGLVITNGLAEYGGGILIYNSSPQILNNIITQNRCAGHFQSEGGGIYCYRSNSIIMGNIIEDNTSSHYAAGILCRNANPIIIDNMIINNYGVGNSGILCAQSNPLIKGNTFAENYGSGGSAIGCYENSAPIIEENIIHNNSSGGGRTINSSYAHPLIKNNIIYGNNNSGSIVIFLHNGNPIITGNKIFNNEGTIHCFMTNVKIRNNRIVNNVYGRIFLNYSISFIENNVISNNESGSLPGGIHAENSTTELLNNIVWSNTAPNIWSSGGDISINYCNIQDTIWTGVGNISVDPLFRDPDNGDFHLMSIACGDTIDSPCIDTGDPNVLDSLLDCSWGLGATRSDMGAYGGGDSVTVGIEFPSTPQNFYLSQNYPNPFNASTTIRYSLSEQSDVSIEIYDILGRVVETLAKSNQQPGEHQITWNADEHPSGVYFYRIQTGDYIETKKMVLLK